MASLSIKAEDIKNALEVIDGADEIARGGFYKRDGYRKADAMHRRNFLEDILDNLDDMIEHNNSMDQVTRNKYNDLRGMILNLLIDENANVRIGVRERRIY